MKICYIGQQGWLISAESTTILVDPVLTETFGTSENMRFRVYPPRSVSINKMPIISAVFITNEHLDHFHLPSLNRLDRNIPIFVGELMPTCVKDAITTTGFNLVSLKNQENLMIGDLLINFFIGNGECPFWEKRVYQLYCREKRKPQCGGIYIQSDTLLNTHFVNQVKAKLMPSPDVYITTNNAQILPNDALGALDNILPIPDMQEGHGLTGLKILDEILIKYVDQLPHPKHIVLSGGGYIQDKDSSRPFLFSDYKYLAGLANQLSLDTTIHGLLPGEEIDFELELTKPIDWISLDVMKWENYKNNLHTSVNEFETTLSKPLFAAYSNDAEVESALKVVEDELHFMSKTLIYSSLGNKLLSSNEYLDGPTSSQRFVFNFRTACNNNSFQYALDLQKGQFIALDPVSISTLIRQFPFGIDVFLEDFCALLEGQIQIWELATANMRQWYLGNKLESPVAFLYKYFSEQVRQDLSTKVYQNLYAQ